MRFDGLEEFLRSQFQLTPIRLKALPDRLLDQLRSLKTKIIKPISNFRDRLVVRYRV